MANSKAELIEELNRILMIHDVNWHLLPQEDLEKLIAAFRKLKSEFDQLFDIFDQIFEIPVPVETDSKLWRDYVA